MLLLAAGADIDAQGRGVSVLCACARVVLLMGASQRR
jgi:hypothetical protein